MRIPWSLQSLRASATSREKSLPWAAREAALYVASRIPFSSIAMLATMKATDWRWLIGSPKASRSLTYGVT